MADVSAQRHEVRNNSHVLCHDCHEFVQLRIRSTMSWMMCSLLLCTAPRSPFNEH